MMSLGRSHRLQLLSRLDRLERQGVRWTAEEVASCYTMEQFLDYLEARRESEVAAPATASSQQALRPRVHPHLLPLLCQRAPRRRLLPPRTGGQFLMLEEAIRRKIEMMGGQSRKKIATISRKFTLRALLQHLRRLSRERIPPDREQTCPPQTMLGSLRWIDFFFKVFCQTKALLRLSPACRRSALPAGVPPDKSLLNCTAVAASSLAIRPFC